MVGLIVQSFDVEEFPSRRSARLGLAWLCKTPGQTANHIVQIYFISKRLVSSAPFGLHPILVLQSPGSMGSCNKDLI